MKNAEARGGSACFDRLLCLVGTTEVDDENDGDIGGRHEFGARRVAEKNLLHGVTRPAVRV